MMLTKDLANKIVKKAKGNKNKIIAELRNFGFNVIDDTWEKCFNIKVNNPDGTMIRIFQTYSREVKVQLWEPVIMKYSGILVFDPSRPTLSHR